MTVPIYERIYSDLKRKILSGELKPGDHLPVDGDLEDTYGVSRSPVRQALGRLSSEGLIIRGAGRRSRVADSVKPYQWAPGTGFRRLFEREWEHMVCKTVIAEASIPPEAARVFLKLDNGVKVTHLLRVQYLYGDPFLATETYLAPEYPLDFFQSLGDIPGLREVIGQRFGRVYKHIRESIGVAPVPSLQAELLEVDAGTPMLEICRFVTDERGLPLNFHKRFAKTNKWRYEVTF